jgi:hypothetical protein
VDHVSKLSKRIPQSIMAPGGYVTPAGPGNGIGGPFDTGMTVLPAASAIVVVGAVSTQHGKRAARKIELPGDHVEAIERERVGDRRLPAEVHNRYQRLLGKPVVHLRPRVEARLDASLECRSGDLARNARRVVEPLDRSRVTRRSVEETRVPERVADLPADHEVQVLARTHGPRDSESRGDRQRGQRHEAAGRSPFRF